MLLGAASDKTVPISTDAHLRPDGLATPGSAGADSWAFAVGLLPRTALTRTTIDERMCALRMTCRD